MRTPDGELCREVGMEGSPNTILVIVAFAAIFAAGLIWATHGHPSNADNEDLGVVGKDH